MVIPCGTDFALHYTTMDEATVALLFTDASPYQTASTAQSGTYTTRFP